MSKASMKSSLPQFNSQRMVMDYIRGFYGPAAEQGRATGEKPSQATPGNLRHGKPDATLWPSVALRRVEEVPHAVNGRETR